MFTVSVSASVSMPGTRDSVTQHGHYGWDLCILARLATSLCYLALSLKSH